MNNGYGQMAVGSGSPLQTFSGDTMLSPQVAKTPPMNVSLGFLAENLERLTQALQLLQGKLEPVLYAEPPMNKTGAVDAHAPRASSDLGAAINRHADHVTVLTELVNSMTRRCEL